MNRFPLLILGAWLGLCCAAALGDDVVRAGVHYRVICHFASDEIAVAALETAEDVWPIAEDLFSLKQPPPPAPLEIHLYRNAATYEQAEARITAGRFRENLAFSDWNTKSAHVALQPDCGDEALAARRLAEQGRLPALDALLRDQIDDFPVNARYGLRWLLFRFMQAEPRRAAWKQVLAEARRLGGGAEYAEQLRAATVKIIGADQLPALDQEFQKFSKELKPRWDEVFRTLDARGNIWTQMAFPDANAVAWCTDPVGNDEYAVSGALRILPGGNQQLNLLLGRADTGFLSAAFVAGYGVTLFEYHADRQDAWERLGSVEVAEFALDRWTPFRVGVRNENLEININDRSVVKAPLRGRSMRGPWGLGVQAGSAGQWRDIKLEP